MINMLQLEVIKMPRTIPVIGFEPDEIANYMRLLLKGDSTQAERM